MKKLQQVLMLALCFLVLAVAATQRNGKVWGHSVKAVASDSVKTTKIDTMHILDDGTRVINTTELGKDIVGYSGAVPLEIYIKKGIIVQVKALKNAETPEFFEQVQPLLSKWNGKTIEEALALKVDAISGATYSSHGIIGNMQQGLAYAAKKSGATINNRADESRRKDHCRTPGCTPCCHRSAVLSQQALSNGTAIAQCDSIRFWLWHLFIMVVVC